MAAMPGMVTSNLALRVASGSAAMALAICLSLALISALRKARWAVIEAILSASSRPERSWRVYLTDDMRVDKALELPLEWATPVGSLDICHAYGIRSLASPQRLDCRVATLLVGDDSIGSILGLKPNRAATALSSVARAGKFVAVAAW